LFSVITPSERFNVGRRPRLVEERRREIAQVDHLEGKVGALLGDLIYPVRGLFAEAAFSG